MAIRVSVLKHVPHAFSTRHGGVSEGMFASLNFGNPSDLPLDDRDTVSNIAENYRRLLAAIGAEGRKVREVHQVHGAEVVVHERGESYPKPDPKADALVTDDPGCMIAVRVADCVPVLFASGDGRVVGVAHAGWRGVVSGVVPATLQAVKALGAAEIVAAIGPCISGEVFEVGEEVAAEFERVYKPETLVVLRKPEWAKPHVDLKRAIFLQLASGGAVGAQVLPNCTYSEPALFFSHRREHGRTGRLVAVIGPIASA